MTCGAQTVFEFGVTHAGRLFAPNASIPVNVQSAKSVEVAIWTVMLLKS
jgi:hypothetical protein